MRRLLFALLLVSVLALGTPAPVHAEETFSGTYGIQYNVPGWSNNASYQMGSTFDGTQRRTVSLSYHVQGDNIQYYGRANFRIVPTLWFADGNPKTIYYYVQVIQTGATDGVFNVIPTGIFTGLSGGEAYGSTTIVPGGVGHRWDSLVEFVGNPYMPSDLYGINYTVGITFSLDPFALPFTEIPALVYIDHTESNNGINDAAWTVLLRDYFAEANALLAKSTNKRLLFSSLQIADTPPEVFHARGVQPCAGNWNGNGQVKILFSTNDGGVNNPLDGGWTLGTDCDGYGTIVVNTMHLESHNWIPPSMAQATQEANTAPYCSDYCDKYWKMVSAMVHELAHVYGQTVESYDFEAVTDEHANFVPDLSWNRSTTGDKWWSGTVYGDDYKHPGFLHDIMVPYTWIPSEYQSMTQIRNTLNVSPVTSAFFNSVLNLRPQITIGNDTDHTAGCDNILAPSLQHVIITQYQQNGSVAPGILVRAWLYQRLKTQPIYAQTQELVGTTDANGQVSIDWDGVVRDFDFICGDANTFYDAFLIKSYAPDGSQFGDPQVLDAYNIELAAFNGMVTNYYLAMTAPRNLTYTLTAPSVAANSGKVTETSQGAGTGGSHAETSLQVGDTATNQGIRSVIQFDTSALPDNAIIDSATLNITVSSIGGSLSNFGPVGNRTSMNTRIGIPCIGLCQVQNGDWQQTGVSDVGTIGPLVVGGVLIPDQHLTFTTNLGYINKTGVTEFRLQYSNATDADGVVDRANLALPGGAGAPTLTVNYHLP